jgi:hypothetical protein
MRSKPKKSDCGTCEESCNTEWCGSKPLPLNLTEYIAEPGFIMPIKWVSKEELERMYPKKRTESEQFMYDLIQGYSGGIGDKSINNVLCFGEWDRSFFSDENGED